MKDWEPDEEKKKWLYCKRGAYAGVTAHVLGYEELTSMAAAIHIAQTRTVYDSVTDRDMVNLQTYEVYWYTLA